MAQKNIALKVIHIKIKSFYFINLFKYFLHFINIKFLAKYDSFIDYKETLIT